MNQTAIDEMTEAASFGRTEAVSEALASGVDVNAQNSNGWTVIHYAVMNGNPDLIRCVLEAGADPGARTPTDDQTAMGLAAACGKAAVIEQLSSSGMDVESPGKNDWTALHIAVKEGKAAAVEKLLSLGADIEARDIGQCTPLHLAAFYGERAIFERLLAAGAKLDVQDDGGSTVVHLVVKSFKHGITSGSMTMTSQDGETHEFWFDGTKVGVRVDGKEKKITKKVWEQMVEGRMAPWEKNKGLRKIVTIAFNKGLDPNLGNSVGCTTLHLLVEIGELALAKQAVKAGGDIKLLSEEKLSVLQVAAKNGQKAAVSWLIKSAAAVDSADTYGFTALHDAAENGHTTIVNALLKAGADPGAGTTAEIDGIAAGTTAADLAEKGGHTAAARALRKAMA